MSITMKSIEHGIFQGPLILGTFLLVPMTSEIYWKALYGFQTG